MSKLAHRRERTDNKKSGDSIKRMKHKIQDFFFGMSPRHHSLPATPTVETAASTEETVTRDDTVETATPAEEAVTRYDTVTRPR